MYAIAFDLKIDDLKREYGDPFNGAYDEIRRELTTLGFDWTQGSVYISNGEKDSFTTVYKAINKLSNIGWFNQIAQEFPHLFRRWDESRFLLTLSAYHYKISITNTEERRRPAKNYRLLYYGLDGV